MKTFPRRVCLRNASGLLLSLLLAACASVSTAPPSPGRNPDPPANVNLSGYPLEFRQGYADGCASARGSVQRDEARFKSDVMYRQGWGDGKAICQKR